MKNWKEPTIRKNKSGWYIEYFFFHKGEWRRLRYSYDMNRIKSEPKRDKYAHQMRVHLLQMLENGFDPFEEKQVLGIDQCVQLILDELKENYSVSTYQNYKGVLNRFVKFCSLEGLGDPSEVKSKDIVRFVESYKSRNQAVKFVKAFFNRLIEKEIVEHNPVKIKEKKQDKKPRIPLTPAEKLKIKEYLSTVHPRFLLFIETMYYCGLRPRELLLVKFGDIQGNEIFVSPEVSKVRVQQKAPCPKYIRDQLKGDPDHYIFSKPHTLLPGPKAIHRNRVTEIWKILIKEKLNIEKDMYSIRHLSAIDHYKNNKDLYSLMRFLRHRDISMTQNYMEGLVGFSMEVNLDAGLDF